MTARKLYIPANPWYCYLLFSSVKKTRSYIGATTDLKRRLRQHNGLLTGGARYRLSNRPWQIAAYVFVGDKIRALKLEWKLKRASGPVKRLELLNIYVKLKILNQS